MTKSIKAACGTVALAMVLLGATTAARAEIVRGGGGGAAPPGVGWSWGNDDGGGGGSSGGAPSPEVNTVIGFLIVAGTVAFIKRRRGDKAEAENAVV